MQRLKHDTDDTLKVQRSNFLYTLFMPVFKFGIRCHYRCFHIHGTENIPREAPYMLAPCHQQTLMDAFVMLPVAPKPPVFLTRADIFSKKAVLKTHSFLRILPIYRTRDGMGKLSQNFHIFNLCRQALLDGTPLCLMAEGRHNNRHQLLPLGKGMFRIACITQQALHDKPLFIVPVGIDYDTYEQPYGNLVVNIGTPMAVPSFMKVYAEDEALALNKMRDTLSERLSSLMLDIHSKGHYEEIYTLCNILNKKRRSGEGLGKTAWNCFVTRQKIARQLDLMETTAADKFERILPCVQQYEKLCRKLNIDVQFPSERLSLPATFGLSLSLAVVVTLAALFPAIGRPLLFCLLCYPFPLIPTHLIFKKMRIDPQFKNSFNFILRYLGSIAYCIAIGLAITFGEGLWMNRIIAIGAWWGLAAVAIQLLGAAISRFIGSFLLSLAHNIHYWTLRLFKPKEMKEIDTLLGTITNDGNF